MPLSLPNAGGAFELAWGSALRASHFLLLRQKKVSKEKATPGFAVPFGDSPALLETGGATPRVLLRDAAHHSGRCGTRPCGPQTVLGLFPPASPLLGAPHGDPKGVSAQRANAQFRRRHSGESRNPEKPRHWTPAFAGVTGQSANAQSTDGLPGPLRGAEQRRNAGGSRRGLSEGRRPEFRSRPAFRVAQGTPEGGTDPGSPFLCLLSFGEAKESKTPRKGGTNSQSNPHHTPETP